MEVDLAPGVPRCVGRRIMLNVYIVVVEVNVVCRLMTEGDCEGVLMCRMGIILWYMTLIDNGQ